MPFGPLKILIRVISAVCMVLAVLIFFTHSSSAVESPYILLLSAHDSEPYAQTVASFEEHFKQSLPGAEINYHLIGKDEEVNGSRFVAKTSKSDPDIIVALGSRAAQVAQQLFPDTQILSTMVLQDNLLEKRINSNLLLVQFSAEVQLQWLHKFIPDVRRVGVLYDPDLNSHLIKEMQEAARKLDMEIVSFKVNSAKQLKSGLKYISRNADVLLAIPDQTVYSGKTAKNVLLFSYRNRIPFVGLSLSWVKAGALYSLGVDYHDLGRQAAETAKKLLTEKPRVKRSIYPDKVLYSLNTRTMEHLRLKMTADLIKGSAQVFE